MSDTRLVVASHYKDNIERAIQERQGHREANGDRVIEAAYLMLDL